MTKKKEEEEDKEKWEIICFYNWVYKPNNLFVQLSNSKIHRNSGACFIAVPSPVERVYLSITTIHMLKYTVSLKMLKNVHIQLQSCKNFILHTNYTQTIDVENSYVHLLAFG